MRKGTIGVSQTVLLIAMLIGFLVILGVTGVFAGILHDIQSQGECELSLLLSSMSKTAGTAVLPPECEMKRVLVNFSELEKDRSSARKKIIAYENKIQDKYDQSEYINYFKSRPEEYLMDEMIAKEMKRCWDMTGRGNLDLFSNWWTFYDCDPSNDYQPCEEKPWLTKAWVTLKQGGPDAPTFCILCSRIKFAESEDRYHDKMHLWLANNAPLGSKIPYAAYLQNERFQGIFNADYAFSTSEPLAVVYARVNKPETKRWIDTGLDWLKITEGAEIESDAINSLLLVPYKDVPNYCTYAFS